jgi:hypothetical protein
LAITCLLVVLNSGQRLLEGHRLGGDHVHQRAALHAGEDRRVDRLLVLGLHQDQAAARAAQGLVRGRGHHIGMRHRVRIEAGRHQAGEVRHVHHEDRADLLRDLGEALEVDHSAIGRGAGDDHLRLVLAGQALHLGVVDDLRCR